MDVKKEKEEGNSADMEMEVLLLRKKIEIQHRFFCFEFKENSRLQFLTISHNGFSISLPSSGISGFLDAMEFLSSGFQNQQEQQDNDQGFTKKKELKINDKVFCFAIGWIRRGHFLKVWEASLSANKNTGIIIPSADNGWELFKNTLAEIDKTSRLLFPPCQGASIPDSRESAQNCSALQVNVNCSQSKKVTIGESKMMRAGVKKFFFDYGSNNKGDFLKISEVMGANRFSIIIPMSSLQQFHEMLGHFLGLNCESLTSTIFQQNSSLHIGGSKELNVVELEEDSASREEN